LKNLWFSIPITPTKGTQSTVYHFCTTVAVQPVQVNIIIPSHAEKNKSPFSPTIGELGLYIMS